MDRFVAANLDALATAFDRAWPVEERLQFNVPLRAFTAAPQPRAARHPRALQ
jgi:hypothetical protein